MSLSLVAILLEHPMGDESYEIEESEDIGWVQHGEDGLSEGHDV